MTKPGAPVWIHATAEVHPTAELGPGTRVWNNAQVRERAQLGDACVVGSGAYVDAGVRVGARSKIENAALLFAGTTLGEGVFVGPAAIITNDRRPRAVAPDGHQLSAGEWPAVATSVESAASIGAGAVVVAGSHIGPFAMVGAGSVVTRPVPGHALVTGNPARLVGWVCRCGESLVDGDGVRAAAGWAGMARCPGDGAAYLIGDGSCRSTDA